MSFVKYMHIERLTSPEVEGILEGTCHIMYKIDGTNASVWTNKEGQLQAGSRNRTLDLENDNAGFCNWVHGGGNTYNLQELCSRGYRLYGEWLVPHSLKTYRDDAWKRFYVFDVLDSQTEQMLTYEDYKALCEEFNLDYIPPLAIIKNPTHEDLYRLLENSGQFLVEDGKGRGEGIVIKNYSWVNKHGRQTWAKIVTNEFKEANHKIFGAPLVHGSLLIEERIVQEFLTEAFILKEQAKIVQHHQNEYYGRLYFPKEPQPPEWNSKMIPELLGRVWYEFIREEISEILKTFKNPTINFRLLQQLVIKRIKEVIGI